MPPKYVSSESRDFYARLGARLRDARLDVGLTAEDVAETIAVAPSSVHAYERGDTRISLYDVLRLAGLYDVDLGDLIPHQRVNTVKM